MKIDPRTTEQKLHSILFQYFGVCIFSSGKNDIKLIAFHKAQFETILQGRVFRTYAINPRFVDF